MLVCKIIFSLFDNFLVFGCVCVGGVAIKLKLEPRCRQNLFLPTYIFKHLRL